MSLSVPIIEGKVQEVRLRKKEANFSLQRILALVRQEAGIPPYKLRDPDLTQDRASYRDVALYLAYSYDSVNIEDLSIYFSLPKAYVSEICSFPLTSIQLPLLEHYQRIIELMLTDTIAFNVEAGRPLYCDEVFSLEDSGQGTFTPSLWIASPEEEESYFAYRGLVEFYGNRGELFDIDQFWAENEDYEQWNVCPYNPIG